MLGFIVATIPNRRCLTGQRYGEKTAGKTEKLNIYVNVCSGKKVKRTLKGERVKRWLRLLMNACG
ncbi:hypothetical protein HMPREF1991_02750 [Hoylesella loescheii DSM 19665 = JCM 12249 = ATCC 15930]|uniref:Uncharacterized protein n=1 Tax=Hoylesella loescheii DSM 19665 = JCM 12249 = ATCC 15930 TaxID=1122985 RepID=A0A069QEV4_HOYLO|nr:hypothetical protein HMPREF1991_02750 [Hoylesella loescheii DSM 19665 = JCM 12249 = ATCC 15930]